MYKVHARACYTHWNSRFDGSWVNTFNRRHRGASCTCTVDALKSYWWWYHCDYWWWNANFDGLIFNDFQKAESIHYKSMTPPPCPENVWFYVRPPQSLRVNLNHLFLGSPKCGASIPKTVLNQTSFCGSSLVKPSVPWPVTHSATGPFAASKFKVASWELEFGQLGFVELVLSRSIQSFFDGWQTPLIPAEIILECGKAALQQNPQRLVFQTFQSRV